jgi:hypothetical protein
LSVQSAPVCRPNTHEVEAVAEVPFFCSIRPAWAGQREHAGQIYDVLVWEYGPYTIWGATARILKEFLDLLS